MDIYNLAVEKEDVGIRIDVFVSENFDDISRSGVQKLIEQGHITVNEKNIKSNYKLRDKDIIKVEIPEPVEIEILPEDIPLDIL